MTCFWFRWSYIVIYEFDFCPYGVNCYCDGWLDKCDWDSDIVSRSDPAS